ncbi:tetratricopeptide repeat protein [Nodosilinea sp. AN01ver1]|uniref:tetratricopeptide repeat protein n=1 Tax=Nodosilinea sp. AN01ver1 TaxID=3423362 RepID=UPI003D312138
MVNGAAAIAVCFPLITLITAWPAQAASASAGALPVEVVPWLLAQTPVEQAALQRQRAALLYNQGDLAGAAALLEPALAAYLAGSDPNQIQQTASFLGLVYAELGDAAVDSGSLAVALNYYQQQIDTLAVGFNRAAEVEALVNAGQVAAQQGQTALARQYLETGLSIAQEVGNPVLIQQVQSLLDG